jgi:hypothetical protein
MLSAAYAKCHQLSQVFTKTGELELWFLESGQD